MMRALAAVAITSFALACGGATSTEAGDPADGGGADAAETGTDAGYTIVNGTHCCAEGTGTQCCAPDESSSKCTQYGGALGRCGGAGELYSSKVPCSQCCAGMVAIGATVIAADGSCSFDGPRGSLVCAPCGDGVCDPASGENRCSCPQDCPTR